MGAHRFASMEKRGESLEGSIATKSASVFDGMSEASHDVSEIFTEFTRTQLISGLSNKSFRKVLFLTGAGISVAAGIPDFRTPGIGLYAQARKLGMDRPEEIFNLDCFKENPQNFYSIGGTLLLHPAIPVNPHRFIKHFENEGLLHMCFTQNVDGLELDAGVSQDKLIQAHGHMRSASCCNCKEPCSMELFKAHVESKTVLRCKKYDECGGFVKPNVTFFGEKLPEEFHGNIDRITEADLVFVMGTSLQVAPFSFLVSIVDKSVPIVLINRDKLHIGDRSNFLFLQGDIEDHIKQICSDVGWQLDVINGSKVSEMGEEISKF